MGTSALIVATNITIIADTRLSITGMSWHCASFAIGAVIAWPLEHHARICAGIANDDTAST